MIKSILILIAFLALTMLLLSVGVIFRKDHQFRSMDVGASPEMRKRGIHCTKAQDAQAQIKAKQQAEKKNHEHSKDKFI